MAIGLVKVPFYPKAGIATRYGLDGPGIESRWGARFYAPVQTDPGAHPDSYAMDTGSFTGPKRPGRGVDHPPASSADVKERVELYLYSPSGPSWLCSRVNTFTFTLYPKLPDFRNSTAFWVVTSFQPLRLSERAT
jgi:hypothetical protein